jgi:hypothetical protein
MARTSLSTTLGHLSSPQLVTISVSCRLLSSSVEIQATSRSLTRPSRTRWWAEDSFSFFLFGETLTDFLSLRLSIDI